MCTSKNRAATMCTKGASPWRPRGTTSGSSSTARKTVPQQEWALAAAAIHSGKLGKLLVSRALCYKPRGSIGFMPTADPPAEVAFDIWLGPAPKQPYHRNLVHYNWHWFWDFGNGDIGNQGVHEMDKARWLIPSPSPGHGKSATYPKTVLSLGGRFGYRDQGETANTQISIMDYGDTQLIFEVRGLTTDGFHGQKVGNIAHLESGILVGGKFYPKGESEAVPLASVVKLNTERGPGNGHFGNFIAAVRSRKVEDLNADILEGHYSAALCHLANISYRTGNRGAVQQVNGCLRRRQGCVRDIWPDGRAFERQWGGPRRTEVPPGTQAHV